MTAPALSRSDRKHAAILTAAAEAFRTEGFQAASMDRIAEKAGVSKRTIYNHFPSKDALFDVVVEDAWARLVPERQASIHAGTSVAERLKSVAHQRLDSLLDPELLTLFRATLAESIRSPELGRAYRDARGHLGLLGLLEVLREEVARGRLRIADLELAASHFWGLVLGHLFWPVVLGLREPPSEAERAHAVDAGVAVFLASYGRPPLQPAPPPRRPARTHKTKVTR